VQRRPRKKGRKDELSRGGVRTSKDTKDKGHAATQAQWDGPIHCQGNLLIRQ